MPALKNRLLQITRLFGPTEAPSPELSQAGHPLSGETISGGAYLAARYGLGVLVSVANMLVMTWWIGPHSYGLFVTAIGIVAFLATLARGGIDIYLVRSETPPDFRSYSTATTLILAGSIALSIAGAALTPLLVRWYGNREFVFPYLLLLMTIPVTGLTGVPMASLERALDFRRIAAVELASQSAGLIVAALLAWSRAGVWAPVMGQITWQVFTLLAVATAAPRLSDLQFDLNEARKMLSYGMSLTVSLRTWQLRTLVNPLLVGRFAGAEAVAFVALAIRVAEALGAFRLAAGRIAIAALARHYYAHSHCAVHS
jgi:O-antigen/teichoic acid export membrane protein